MGTENDAIFNAFEAGFWMVLGAITLVIRARAEAKVRRTLAVAVVALVLFGISDIVEMQTGAWWEPPWLLAWKAACVVALVGCAVMYRKRKAGGTTNSSLN